MLKTLLPLILLAATTGCERPGAEPAPGGVPASISIAGELERKGLDEVSGMALSRRNAGMLWLHNDSGSKARVYAVDLEGRHLGRLKIADADNRDWEDMASFSLDGVPYLLLADIGDNESRHEYGTLYVVEEPDLDEDDEPEQEPAWQVRFRYPDGPRDAEAVAVDTANRRALILTKRDIPPVLYAVPLQPEQDDVVVAERLGPVTSLPPPSRQDVEFAPQTKIWHWQPTGMDIATDGSAAVILTYAAVYYYPFLGDWYETLNQQALGFGLRGIRDAEAVAFGAARTTLFVTVERRHAPLLRIDRDRREQ